MAAAFTATPDLAREQLYAALVRRNRLVGALRIVVPLLGALVLAVIVGAIVLDNLREQFGFASISIDRDNLVVDTPKVTGPDDEGTLYSATARTAKVRIGSPDIIDMVDAVLTLKPLDSAVFTAAAPSAALQATTQTLTVPGTMSVSSDDGLRGTLDDFYGDVLNWRMTAYGAVDLTFPRGMRVEARGMTYDGNARVWSFERATVTLPETPGGAVEESPPTMEIAP